METLKDGWSERPSWIAGAYLSNRNATASDITEIAQHRNSSTRLLAVQHEKCPEEIAIATYLAG